MKTALLLITLFAHTGLNAMQFQCFVDEDCLSDEFCVSHRCVMPSFETPELSRAAEECLSDADCSTDQTCDNGVCVDNIHC